MFINLWTNLITRRPWVETCWLLVLASFTIMCKSRLPQTLQLNDRKAVFHNNFFLTLLAPLTQCIEWPLRLILFCYPGVGGCEWIFNFNFCKLIRLFWDFLLATWKRFRFLTELSCTGDTLPVWAALGDWLRWIVALLELLLLLLLLPMMRQHHHPFQEHCCFFTS